MKSKKERGMYTLAIDSNTRLEVYNDVKLPKRPEDTQSQGSQSSLVT